MLYIVIRQVELLYGVSYKISRLRVTIRSYLRYPSVFYAATCLLKVSRASSEIVLFLGKGLYLGNSTINKTISEI